MKTDRATANTPNKLAKWVLSDCLEIADYIGDDCEFLDNGMVKGYVRGVKVEMTQAEWGELHSFIDKHAKRINKLLGAEKL